MVTNNKKRGIIICVMEQTFQMDFQGALKVPLLRSEAPDLSVLTKIERPLDSGRAEGIALGLILGLADGTEDGCNVVAAEGTILRVKLGPINGKEDGSSVEFLEGVALVGRVGLIERRRQ